VAKANHGGQKEAAAQKHGKKEVGKEQKKKAKKHQKAGKKDKSVKKQKKAGKKLDAEGRQSSSCLPTNCLDLAVAYIGVLRTKVSNYQKQVTRLGKLNSTSTGKSGKQNAFSNARNHLLAQGGGNLSQLTCGSSTNNTGTLLHATTWYYV